MFSLPKSRVSVWPPELVHVDKVIGEIVTPGEPSVFGAQVTQVLGSALFVFFFDVIFDIGSGFGRVAAPFKRTHVGLLVDVGSIMSVYVVFRLGLVVTAFLRTRIRLDLEVLVVDVGNQGRGLCTGHVT